MLDNVHSQHPNCNANQHREGKNWDQYRYWKRLDRTYWEWTADRIIEETQSLYSYTVQSISEDIDSLLTNMFTKLQSMKYKDVAYKMLEKRLWKKIYKILFEDYLWSEGLYLFFKKK